MLSLYKSVISLLTPIRVYQGGSESPEEYIKNAVKYTGSEKIQKIGDEYLKKISDIRNEISNLDYYPKKDQELLIKKRVNDTLAQFKKTLENYNTIVIETEVPVNIQTCDSMVSRIVDLDTKLMGKTAETDKLRIENKENLEKIAELESYFNEMSDMFNELNETIDQLQKKYDDMNNNYRLSQESNKYYQNERVPELINELQNIRGLAHKRGEEAMRLNAEMTKLREYISELRNSKRDMADESTNLINQQIDLQKKLRDKINNISTLSEQVEKLKQKITDLESINKVHEQTISDQQKQLDILNEQIKNMQISINSVSELKQLKDTVIEQQKLKSQINELQQFEPINANEATINQLKLRLRQAMEANEKIKQEYEAKLAETESLLDQSGQMVNDLTNELSLNDEQVDMLKYKNAQLLNEQEVMRESHNSMAQELRDSKANIARLKQEKREIEVEKNQKIKEISRLQDTIDNNEIENNNLRAFNNINIDDIKQKYDNQIIELNKQISNLESEIEQKNKIINQMDIKLNDSTTEYNIKYKTLNRKLKKIADIETQLKISLDEIPQYMADNKEKLILLDKIKEIVDNFGKVPINEPNKIRLYLKTMANGLATMLFITELMKEPNLGSDTISNDTIYKFQQQILSIYDSLNQEQEKQQEKEHYIGRGVGIIGGVSTLGINPQSNYAIKVIWVIVISCIVLLIIFLIKDIIFIHKNNNINIWII